MDPRLYYDIASPGGSERLKNAPAIFLQQCTKVQNTTLHVAVQFENEECAEEILNICPWLLTATNIKGDTALHIAARQGSCIMTGLLLTHAAKEQHRENSDVESSGEIIEGVKKLLRIANKVRDTALHEAVRHCNVEVVKLLTEADPEFEYFANDADETPLFLAAEFLNKEMVTQILQTCPSSAHGGPNGMTALHAVALSYQTDLTEILLEKKPAILRQTDNKGWTALHYAAFNNSNMIAAMLFQADNSLIYLQDENGMSPLHLAVSQGHNDLALYFIQCFPDCQELLGNYGQNFLHIAVLKRSTHFITQVLNTATITKEVINQPDHDGNMPLHLAATYKYYEIVMLFCRDQRVKKWASNKENFCATNILTTKYRFEDVHSKMNYQFALEALRCDGLFGPRLWIRRDIREPSALHQHDNEEEKEEEQRKKEEAIQQEEQERIKKAAIQKIQKVSDSHLVVAALIATVTFAAGFALPGGYKNDGPDEGMATLLRDASFKAFAVSNTISMLFSSFAIFVHFLLKLIDDDETTRILLVRAFLCTFMAIWAMMLAFITGVYAVLATLPVLAITICVIGSSFYVFCVLLLRKYFFMITSSLYYV